MAVGKVYRVFVFALKVSVQDVLAEIQDFASVHLDNTRDVIEELKGEPASSEGPAVSRKLAQIESALAALAPYEKPLRLLQKLAKERPRYRVEDLARLDEALGADHLAAEVNVLSDRDMKLAREADSLQAALAALAPWEALSDKLSAVAHPTPTAVGLFVKVPARAHEELSGLDKNVAWEVLARTESQIRLIAVVWRDAAEETKRKIAEMGGEVVALPAVDRTPSEESQRIRREIETIRAERATLVQELAQLASKLEPLRACRDYLAIRLQREEARELLSSTERVAVLSGYVPESARDQLARRLEPFGSAVKVVFEGPVEDESAPVVLSNNAVVEPFEMVTRIFGLPQRREFDPTPIITPFFALFFAIALTDAGYGLVLVIASLLAARFLKLSSAVKGFMRLLLIGGVMTVAMGVVTGGYFSIPVERLPAFARRLVLVDPMTEPTTFLYMVLALGFFQVWFGMILSFIKHARFDGLRVALYLDLSWIVLLPSVALFLAAGASRSPPSGWPPDTYPLPPPSASSSSRDTSITTSSCGSESAPTPFTEGRRSSGISSPTRDSWPSGSSPWGSGWRSTTSPGSSEISPLSGFSR